MIDWHLEQWEDDVNRVRVVTENGQTGDWFSHLRHTGDDGILEVPEKALPIDLANAVAIEILREARRSQV